MKNLGSPKGRPPAAKKLLKSEIDSITAPAWFTAYAVDAFTQLKPFVADKAKTSDMPLFYSMCVAYGKVMEAEQSIKENGLLVRNEKGALVKNPLWSIQKEAVQVFNALVSKFGLSPVDRVRIDGERTTSDENSPMAQLLFKASEAKKV